MISRFYLEEYLSFKQIDIEFQKGLIVFTGASGAGKSVLMGSILALFGLNDTTAKLSEVTCEDLQIKYDTYTINTTDDIVVKQTTTTKTRYLLNNQTISKKNLKTFANRFTKYLHLKDTTDFDSHKIISFVDFLISSQNTNYKTTLDEYKSLYQEYKTIQKKLQKIYDDEKELDDLIEYTKFEIDKITKIDPKVDEYDELHSIKQKLSKKDKIENLLKEARPILNDIYKISSVLEMLEVDSGFFDDAIAEVHNQFEKFYDDMNFVEDTNIEEVLTRIEQLSSLNKKFGGIQEALDYRDTKLKELEAYENISFEKAILEKNLTKTQNKIEELASNISKIRKQNIYLLENKMEEYLKYLYLENLSIEVTTQTLDETGIDKIEFKLNNTNLNKLSSGEFNRLRLALLTARSFYEIDNSGILFLDEIDANLSGKESQSIAKVLTQLSKHYQIFAISHQPHLSASAKQHFLVQKQNNISTVKLLDKKERVNEIARMISGEDITQEAIKFAKRLLK